MRSMPRSRLLVVALGAAGCGGGAPEEQAQPPVPGPGEINIIVRCQGQQADISLVPWRRVVPSMDSATFNLLGGPNAVSSVTLEPKTADGLSVWPFNGNNIQINAGGSATTPPAPDVEGDSVLSYTVRATCQFPAQGPFTLPGPREVIVDPDIVIRGGGAGDSVP